MTVCVYILPTFVIAENCELEVTVTSNEVEVDSNQDGTFRQCFLACL